MADDLGEEKRGYGHPPKQNRFQPGQSGNPGGRPKGSKSWKRVIEDELAKEIQLKEQGVEAKVTKMEALAKRLVTDALNGDARALGGLLKQIEKYLIEPTAASRDLPASEEDVRLLMKYAQKAIATKAGKEGEDDLSNEF